MTEAQVEELIRRIMARQQAGSGVAVFVDPVVLRKMIEEVLSSRSIAGSALA